MLLPIGETGALETVCARAISSKHDWIDACVNAYLQCGEIKALGWDAEKRDKARLQCMIAALHEDDPNRGIAHLLKANAPIVDFNDAVFDPIVSQIELFRDTVNAA